MPDPRLWWTGLKYNYVYTEEDYDFVYGDDEQIPGVDMGMNDENSSAGPANVPRNCECEQGHCECDPKPNYDLNDAD